MTYRNPYARQQDRDQDTYKYRFATHYRLTTGSTLTTTEPGNSLAHCAGLIKGRLENMGLFYVVTDSGAVVVRSASVAGVEIENSYILNEPRDADADDAA